MIALPGADVIARAARIHVDERVYRLALTIDEKEIIIRCTDKNDPLALQEALEFFRIGDSDLIKLLDDPFTSKSVTGKRFAAGRFSNGDHAVFYSAREYETAGDECAHNTPRYFPAAMGPAVQYRIHLIDCRFNGTASDLQPLSADFPGLIADAHDFCHDVGRARGDPMLSEAACDLFAQLQQSLWGAGLPGLRTTSAREARQDTAGRGLQQPVLREKSGARGNELGRLRQRQARQGQRIGTRVGHRFDGGKRRRRPPSGYEEPAPCMGLDETACNEAVVRIDDSEGTRAHEFGELADRG